MTIDRHSEFAIDVVIDARHFQRHAHEYDLHDGVGGGWARVEAAEIAGILMRFLVPGSEVQYRGSWVGDMGGARW